MATFLVKPNFNKIQQQLSFPAKSLNFFIRSELHDNFGFYQSNFGLYSYMPLNKKLKYVLHTLQGNPLVWQPHKSCGWDETGALRMGKKEFEPCKAKINEGFCYDELFESCFEPFLTWSGRGPINLDANGIDLINQLTRTMAENATLGARLTLTSGQMYDPNAVTFNEDTPNNIQSLFKKTVGTCKGWVELVREMAETPAFRHLNVPNLLPDSAYNGKKYVGDVVQLFDDLKENAPADLQALMNEGGVAGSIAGDFMPMMPVTTDVYNAVTLEFNKQCIAVTCINPRLTRQEFTIQTKRGPRPMWVYYIDQVPVIPVSDINYLDRYITGMTSLAALTVGGNIGLGASFDALPDIENPNIGILIERDTTAKDWGKYYFLAHSLFATTLADTDFFVGTQTFVEPV